MCENSARYVAGLVMLSPEGMVISQIPSIFEYFQIPSVRKKIWHKILLSTFATLMRAIKKGGGYEVSLCLRQDDCMCIAFNRNRLL